MKDILGKPGSVSGMILRLGQCFSAAASIGVMFSAVGFTNYTAFCYLIASMGLQLFWSLGLACLDMYALRIKKDLQNPVLVSLFVVGDWFQIIFQMEASMLRSKSVQNLSSLIVLFFPEMVNLSAPLKVQNFYRDTKVTATLSLAAACSSAGIAVLYARDLKICDDKSQIPCIRLQISVAMAFLTWFLVAISSHVMFWISASV